MKLPAGISTFMTDHVLKPFADKPGVGLPADALKDLTVTETVNGKVNVDHFVSSSKVPAKSLTTGAPLDMTPVVSGGFKEGDIVLRGNSLVTTAQSGLVTTLADGLTRGDWHIDKSAVSHSGIIAKDAQGNLRVIQMVSGDTPKDLAPLLTPMQKRLGGTFIRNDSIDSFFNSQGTPYTSAIVMRPKDPKLAEQASERALNYWQTQVTSDGTHPWFAKLPHSLAPQDRGGVCSTFVDLAYNQEFKLPYHLPTTPEQYVQSPELEKVGDRRITDIQVVGNAGEGTTKAGSAK